MSVVVLEELGIYSENSTIMKRKETMRVHKKKEEEDDSIL